MKFVVSITQQFKGFCDTQKCVVMIICERPHDYLTEQSPSQGEKAIQRQSSTSCARIFLPQLQHDLKERNSVPPDSHYIEMKAKSPQSLTYLPSVPIFQSSIKNFASGGR